MSRKIAFYAVCVAAFGFSSAAQAQTAGSGVKIEGDTRITVQQDKAVTTVAIGQNVEAHTWVGSVIGPVHVKGDVTIDVRQKGAVTTAAIGQNAKASTVVGTITGVSPR